jgi:hypothetical protein
VSLFSRSQQQQRNATEACAVDNIHAPGGANCCAFTAGFVNQLAKPLGAVVAQRRIEQAFWTPPAFNEHAYLRRLRDRLETNISGLMDLVWLKNECCRNRIWQCKLCQ